MLLIIILTSLLTIGNCENKRPVVKTPLGKVRGYHRLSHGGRHFSAFEGVPYAKPPIGERRFKEPEAPEAWIGVWEATFLNRCVQTEPNDVSNVSEGMNISGDEDCLYLYIYVPREYPNPQEKLDVIVHIHGGGFMFGDGHVYAHPDYLMDKDIIFVTFNYRVGVFGFLSTEDEVIPGNYGQKDQVQALRWVQRNIASFGGNPASVTLTGASSGAGSVHLHYFSPLSKRLFHRGSSQSGCGLNPWSVQRDALSKAKMLALAVGCPDSPSKKLLKCLKQRSYHQILKKFTHLYGYKFEPTVIFGPVVENGSQSFLPDDPYVLLKSGKVHDLPWLLSTVSQEGRFFTKRIYKNNVEVINADWEKSAPFALYYNSTAEPSRWQSLAKKMKDKYVGADKKITNDNFDDFIKMFSDRMYVHHAVDSAKLQAKVTISPVYYYYFNYPGDHSTIVEHTDDNKYVFSVTYSDITEKKATQNELKMKDVIVNMLVSFAKTGKPSIDGVFWEPTKSDKLTFLNISGFTKEDMNLQTVDHLTDADFWNSLGLAEGPKRKRKRTYKQMFGDITKELVKMISMNEISD